MKYINQLDYPHLPYPTNLNTPDSPLHDDSIKEAGCGLCCLAMLVDQLTTKTITLKRLASLSHKHRADLLPGTNMKLLGPVVARLFGLNYSTTDDIWKVLEHLQSGGRAIANVGGDRDGYTGVFSHVGHYILLLSVSEDQICILDPSLHPGKYEEEGRQNKVLLDTPFSYCSPRVLEKDAENRSPGYYLFSRKKAER